MPWRPRASVVAQLLRKHEEDDAANERACVPCTPVRISGLSQRPELNGKRGITTKNIDKGKQLAAAACGWAAACRSR